MKVDKEDLHLGGKRRKLPLLSGESIAEDTDEHSAYVTTSESRQKESAPRRKRKHGQESQLLMTLMSSQRLTWFSSLPLTNNTSELADKQGAPSPLNLQVKCKLDVQ